MGRAKRNPSTGRVPGMMGFASLYLSYGSLVVPANAGTTPEDCFMLYGSSASTLCPGIHLALKCRQDRAERQHRGGDVQRERQAADGVGDRADHDRAERLA